MNQRLTRQCLFLMATIVVLFTLRPAVTQAQSDEGSYMGVRDESELRAGESIEEKIRANFFLKTDVSKTECYVGEPIMATFKAYSRLDANSQLVRRPALSDFSVIEMVDAYSNQSEIEKYNGEYYNMHLIRKVQLFPIQEGTFTLETAEVQSVIQFHRAEKSSPGRSLREIFRNRQQRGIDPSLQRTRNFESQPVAILVKPLPSTGQPQHFSGAVGRFRLELQMPENNIEQYEPAIVRLRLIGTGNFPFITGPDINWPQGFEVSGPVIKEDVNRYQYPLSGEKIFEYTIQTNDTGKYTIPPVSLSYFDPAQKRYQTAETETYTFTVEAGKKKQTLETPVVRKAERPLHWYYFGVVAVVIVGWIVFQLLRPKKTPE